MNKAEPDYKTTLEKMANAIGLTISKNEYTNIIVLRHKQTNSVIIYDVLENEINSKMILSWASFKDAYDEIVNCVTAFNVMQFLVWSIPNPFYKKTLEQIEIELDLHYGQDR